MSPISLNYAIKNILKENLNGVIHLTGEKKVSYYDFAKTLIDKKLQPNLIKNIEVNFNKKEYLNNSKKKSMNMNLTKKKQLAAIHKVAIDMDIIIQIKNGIKKILNFY